MSNWTQADLDAHMARLGGQSGGKSAVQAFNSMTSTQAVQASMAAPAKVKQPRQRMNKLEAEYAGMLSIEKMLGRILYYEFEAVTLQLAPHTRFTPDFFVVTSTGIAFHETKGFFREAARVRLNVAAAKFPWFTFYLVRKRLVKEGGGFTVQQVTS